MADFDEGFGPSIFDQEALDAAVDGNAGMPHDPMHGPLRSEFPWQQQPANDVDDFGDMGQPVAASPVDPAPVAPAAQGQVLPRAPRQPHEGPRTAFTPGLPAIAEYMCCLDGPCRHYTERLAELDAVGAGIRTEVNRVCLGFGQPISLSEGTCFACTRYRPNIWTPRTLRRAVIVAHRLGVARRRLGRRTMTFGERIVEAVYGIVKGDAPELPRDER